MSAREATELTTIGDGAARHTARNVALRGLDLAVAVAMLVVLAPLLLVIMVIIKLESCGPVLFRQERVGRDRKPFQVAKFRTMHHGADHEVHRQYMLALIESGLPAPKLASDVRVTRFGGFLRKTSLDELPQLLNVLRGDMSVVGPRPPIPYEVEHYPAHWNARFAVKPGLTGLWQVSGRSTVSLQQMIELDIEYVEKQSVWLNTWILLRTIPAVLTGKGAG